MKKAVIYLFIFFLAGCRVETQWPLESFFNNDDTYSFPKWSLRTNKKFSFYQKELSTDGVSVTFAIGLPETKRGLVIVVDCNASTFHVLETLYQVGQSTFRANDPFYQFDVFGLGIRYLRIAFGRSISHKTVPAIIGSELCSAPTV